MFRHIPIGRERSCCRAMAIENVGTERAVAGFRFENKIVRKRLAGDTRPGTQARCMQMRPGRVIFQSREPLSTTARPINEREGQHANGGTRNRRGVAAGRGRCVGPLLKGPGFSFKAARRFCRAIGHFVARIKSRLTSRSIGRICREEFSPVRRVPLESGRAGERARGKRNETHSSSSPGRLLCSV